MTCMTVPFTDDTIQNEFDCKSTPKEAMEEARWLPPGATPSGIPASTRTTDLNFLGRASRVPRYLLALPCHVVWTRVCPNVIAGEMPTCCIPGPCDPGRQQLEKNTNATKRMSVLQSLAAVFSEVAGPRGYLTLDEERNSAGAGALLWEECGTRHGAYAVCVYHRSIPS